MVVTDFHKKTRPAEHARNLWKLSQAVLKDEYHGGAERARELRSEAQRYLQQRDPDAAGCCTDEAYDRMVSILFR